LELIAANPMSLVGRPKPATTLPKALPTDSVIALLAALASDPEPRRRRDWIERDRAPILTGLLAGLRADELLRANIGDIRRTDDGAVVRVRGKGGKDRRIPIESALVEALEIYLDSRAIRFPARPSSAPPPGDWRFGRRRRPCSWAWMVSGSPAAPCNTGCSRRFAAPASTPTAPEVHSCTGYGTRSHRARQRRRQRLHADEASRPRIHGDLPALRNCRRDRNPHCRSLEQAVRPLSRRWLN